MITLSSDFGSPYPAAMKGVIARRTDARIVDIAHDLPRQGVREAAFWLRFVLPEFPPATHCVVVDPGVGTDRAALVMRAGKHVLVGPDNGVLSPPARALADGQPLECYRIRAENPASSTFHGRDVFAPAAADADSVNTNALESVPRFVPTERTVDLRFPTPTLEDDYAAGEILVVDQFGNAISNVPGTFLDGRTGERLRVETPGGKQEAPVVETFAAVDEGEPLLTVGSHGYVECDVNRGRGDDAFGLGSSDPVEFHAL